MIVAIDGPAGSGKSTVAKALAERLACSYLDTGALYRCVGLAALRRWGKEAALESHASALGRLAESARIELRPRRREDVELSPGEGAEAVLDGEGAEVVLDGEGAEAVLDGEGAEVVRDGEALEVLLDGEDVGSLIRTSEVSEMASVAAASPEVRKALLAKQREMLADGDWVAEGRDIGTVIAPDAELKVFLQADPRERARRRAAELGADIETVLAEQAIRDSRDEDREHSPLRPASDAVVIDTTSLSIAEVVEKIAALAQRRSHERA